ncbi:hypothetical protein LSAT2_003983 [Lamellibrachia satsuma]|nr:hypothetical protein LSAT2_003983 [Lamellibrachia satsuma]
MNALKLTVFMLVVFVALATLIDAFESDEETLSVETRDVRRRQHQPHRHNNHGHNNHGHNNHGHNNQNRRHRRPRICLKRCSKRCRYGDCRCRVKRNWYEIRPRRHCEVCCYCTCDRRGFARCYEGYSC